LLDLPPDEVLARGREAGEFPPVVGESELTEYRFNTRKNVHYFCRHCGVRPFGVGTETPIGKMYGVNIGCLAGVTEEELSRIPITFVDGLHDRLGSPEHGAHL
jgi:hypothetical protein